MAELLLRFKTRLQRRIPLDRPMVRVGRDPSAEVAIDNPSVSRSHCFFSLVDGQWRVTDTGSENGTYVNGEKITERVLAVGDRVELGLFNLTLSESSEASTEVAVVADDAPIPVVEGLGATVVLDGDKIQSMLKTYQAETDAARKPDTSAAAMKTTAKAMPAVTAPAARPRGREAEAAPKGPKRAPLVVMGLGVVLVVLGLVGWALKLY